MTASTMLGQPVVVMNRPGANGAIGSQVAKDAAPDGYTLLLARVGSQVLLEAVIGWSALYGPPKLSPDIVRKWAGVLKAAAGDARWISANATYGGIPRILTPEETTRYVSESFATYQSLARSVGIKVQ